MKRYLVFAGDKYYPSGGWDDHRLSTDDYEEAQALHDKLKEENDWVQLIDLVNEIEDNEE